MTLLSFLISVIWVIYFSIVSLAKGLSILLMFLNNQLLFLLIFSHFPILYLTNFYANHYHFLPFFLPLPVPFLLVLLLPSMSFLRNSYIQICRCNLTSNFTHTQNLLDSWFCLFSLLYLHALSQVKVKMLTFTAMFTPETYLFLKIYISYHQLSRQWDR